jgi:hypothetical protein
MEDTEDTRSVRILSLQPRATQNYIDIISLSLSLSLSLSTASTGKHYYFASTQQDLLCPSTMLQTLKKKGSLFVLILLELVQISHILNNHLILLLYT